MSTKNKITSSYTELVNIGGIGFMFEVNSDLKHNLISPDVLSFFDCVQESEELTKDCAFPLAKENTDISTSLFQYVGHEKVVCFDGTSRICQKIRCKVEQNRMESFMFFYLDNSLRGCNMAGTITQFQSGCLIIRNFST